MPPSLDTAKIWLDTFLALAVVRQRTQRRCGQSPQDCVIGDALPLCKHCNRAAKSGALIVLLRIIKRGSGKSYARAAATSGQANAFGSVLLRFAYVGSMVSVSTVRDLGEAVFVHMYDKLPLLVINVVDLCRLAYSSQIDRPHHEEPDSHPWPVNAEMVSW